MIGVVPNSRAESGTEENQFQVEQLKNSELLDALEERESRLAPLFWLAAVIIIIVVCGLLIRSYRQPKAIAWQNAEVKRGDLQVAVSATGQLKPVKTVLIGSEISGRIIEVLVEANDTVTVGQLLARIDTETLSAELEQRLAALNSAKASVSERKIDVEDQRKQLNRTKELLKGGLESQENYDALFFQLQRSEARLKSAQAQVQSAAAEFQRAKTQLEKARIVSPINGVVLTRDIEPGTTVAASLQAPVLFEIASTLSELTLEADIDEADIGPIKPGLKATFTVDTWTDKVFTAEVEKVHLASTTTNNVVTYTTLLRLSNEAGLLRPGMTALVSIAVKTAKDVIYVPNKALRFQKPKVQDEFRIAPPSFKSRQIDLTTKVWVLEAGQPKAIPVKTGINNDSFTQIENADIAAGMKVLTGWQEL